MPMSQPLSYFGGLEGCCGKDFRRSRARHVLAWTDKPMFQGCWINRSKDNDIFIPRTVPDFCDCVRFVSNDVTKWAVFNKIERIVQSSSQIAQEPNRLYNKIK